MSNIFKDAQGRWYTQALFLETSQYDTLGVAVYTFGDADREYKGKPLKCVRDLYLSCEDPTEYKVATKYFGGWKHWQRLCENKAIMKYIQELREELEVLLRSKGIRSMVASAVVDGNATSAKWLSDRGWSKRKAGAPSKEEKARALKIDDKITEQVAEDLARLRH